MEFNEIGFDFSNLEYGTISKKNSIAFLIIAITSLSFIIIFIVFLILYMFKVPIEINDIVREYSDPEYQNFMRVFLGIMGAISLPSIIYSVVYLLRQPTPYIYINKDSNFETYYQINLSKKKTLYLFDKTAFYYYPLTKETRQLNNYQEIMDLKQNYLFWLKFKDIQNYKVKKSEKKTVLTFDLPRQRTVLKYHYTLYYNMSSMPEKIREIIQNKSSTRNSVNQMNTYFFTSINQVPNISLPSEITAKLNAYF